MAGKFDTVTADVGQPTGNAEYNDEDVLQQSGSGNGRAGIGSDRVDDSDRPSRPDTGPDTGPELPKRRGRPPGSPNKSKGPQTFLQVEAEGVTPTAAPKRRTRKNAQSEAEAQTTALVLITMLNTAAANLAGTDAVMNSFERALIEPSFIRTLGKGGKTADKITSLIDPLALIMGMGMWGSRVLGVRQQTQSKLQTPQAPINYGTGNGVSEPPKTAPRTDEETLYANVESNVSSIDDVRRTMGIG